VILGGEIKKVAKLSHAAQRSASGEQQKRPKHAGNAKGHILLESGLRAILNAHGPILTISLTPPFHSKIIAHVEFTGVESPKSGITRINPCLREVIKAKTSITMETFSTSRKRSSSKCFRT
jgi:hypothetical protein